MKKKFPELINSRTKLVEREKNSNLENEKITIMRSKIDKMLN
jgi:hypothetical protein